MQRRALFFSTIFLLGGLVGSLIGGAAWLSSSENGLQTVVQFISKASAGRLHIEQASGRLLGPLDIATLSWETADLQLRAEQIHLDWSPTALLQSGLQIAELSLGKLHITSTPSIEPTPPPTSLLLPVTVNVKKLAISRLEYGNTFVADRISGQLSSDGRQHHLSDFQIETSGASLHGEATLDGAANWQTTRNQRPPPAPRRARQSAADARARHRQSPTESRRCTPTGRRSNPCRTRRIGSLSGSPAAARRTAGTGESQQLSWAWLRARKE